MAGFGLYGYDLHLKSTSLGKLQSAVLSQTPSRGGLIDPRSGAEYRFTTPVNGTAAEGVIAYSLLADSPFEWLYTLTGRSGRGGCILYADGHGAWYPESQYMAILEKAGIDYMH